MAERLQIGMFPVETPEEVAQLSHAGLLAAYSLLHALAVELARERNELEQRADNKEAGA